MFTSLFLLFVGTQGAYEYFDDVSYEGIGNSSGSVQTRTIKGYKPTDGKKHPVFIWLMGTVDNFEATTYDSFAEQMACNGFVAAIPDYPNQDFCMYPCRDFQEENTLCNFTMGEYYDLLYDFPLLPIERIGTPEKARSLKKALDVICQMPEADCSLGVAMAGHSQGSFTTSYLATIDDRLTAVSPWSLGNLGDDTVTFDTSCYYSDHVSQFLPEDKRRYLVGENDDLSQGNFSQYAGPDCGGGYHDPVDCLQPDGSGYFIISAADYSPEDIKLLEEANPPMEPAAHTFFSNSDPISIGAQLLPTFATGGQPWQMAAALDWLAKTVTGTEAKCFESVLVPGTSLPPTTAPTAHEGGKKRWFAGISWGPFCVIAISPLVLGLLLGWACALARKPRVVGDSSLAGRALWHTTKPTQRGYEPPVIMAQKQKISIVNAV